MRSQHYTGKASVFCLNSCDEGSTSSIRGRTWKFCDVVMMGLSPCGVSSHRNVSTSGNTSVLFVPVRLSFGKTWIFITSSSRITQWHGVLCNPSIYLPFKLWRRIDKRGVRNGYLNNRYFTVPSNGKLSIIDHSRLANWITPPGEWSSKETGFICMSFVVEGPRTRLGHQREIKNSQKFYS